MAPYPRPRGADWLAGILAGALLGTLLLGGGGRISMRIFALLSGQAPSLTWEGTLAVIGLGAAAGAAVGVIFLLSRTLFGGSRVLRVTFFWVVVAAIVLRGLNPVTPLKIWVFAPLFAAHGALLFTWWCRSRMRPTTIS